jgi:Cu-Zn family superoxide dismutase
MKLFSLLIFLVGLSFNIYAASVTVPMYLTAAGNQEGSYVGTVIATDTQYGLLLSPRLHNLTPALTPGIHGFHVHVNPSCADNGMAAGGHLDPQNTGKHLGPYNPNGHLGDLPALYINQDGTSSLPVLAPRLKVSDILGHSLMIHSGGDNYSDEPPMGGGGTRMACGVIPS